MSERVELWLLGHPGWPDGLHLHWRPTTDEEARRVLEEHPHPSAYVQRRTISETREEVIPSARYGAISEPPHCRECGVDVMYRHVHDREAHGWDGRAPSKEAPEVTR